MKATDKDDVKAQVKRLEERERENPEAKVTGILATDKDDMKERVKKLEERGRERHTEKGTDEDKQKDLRERLKMEAIRSLRKENDEKGRELRVLEREVAGAVERKDRVS